MPRRSPTDNVLKRCDCVKWKECAHPWHVSYREGARSLRKKLADLVGREPVNFADAKNEARRAIVAWRDGGDTPLKVPATTQTRALYRPPEGDEPLDAVELALVHALVPVLVREIREELLAKIAARRATSTAPSPTPATAPAAPSTPVPAVDTPWLTAAQASAYVNRGKRFLQREWKLGRLRGAAVGSRNEMLTRREWLDDWIAAHTKPNEIVRRRIPRS